MRNTIIMGQEVPTVEGLVVHIQDGNHDGTDIYLTSDGKYRFVNLTNKTTTTWDNCALVHIEGVVLDNFDITEWGVDLEENMAFIGYDDNLETILKVLWISN